MKKRETQKWYRVYLKDKNGKYRPNPALKIVQPGVYFIKNTAGEIVYIGFSSNNVERTLFRHFRTWNDRTHERITYDPTRNYKVRIITSTKQRAAAMEKLLILKYKPKDNPMKYRSYKFSRTEKQHVADMLRYQKKDFTGINIDSEDPF